MRKHSTLFSFLTYIIVVFLVVGINLLLYFPTKNLENESNLIKEKYENQINNTKDSEEVVSLKDTYNNYIKDMQNEYKAYGRIYTNMIVALLVVISLTLVTTGLSFRVNSNKNKGINNAIIVAGLTCIFYLIWFSISISNSFGLLFR